MVNLIKPCFVTDIGLKEYGATLVLQEKMLEERKRGSIPDVLLLVEHPPVITMGWHAVPEHIITGSDALSRQNIPVFRTKRGGDVTFHGPGQLIAYPILSLKENGLSVTDYIWKLEETAIRTLAAVGITGERIKDWRGVFVERDKICSLGVRVSGGVSMHGLALNVNTDLKYFDHIIPCGLSGIKMTSVAEIQGQLVDMASIKDVLISKFSDVFRFSCETCKFENLIDISNTIDNSAPKSWTNNQ